MGVLMLDDRTRALIAMDIPRLVTEASELIWYVIRVKPGQEFSTTVLINRMGFRPFTPIESRYRASSGRARRNGKVLTDYPIAPGYLFVGFRQVIPPWLTLFQSSAVLGVVGCDGKPSRVSLPVICEWIDKVAQKHFTAPDCQKWMQTRKEYGVGDVCEIAEGPFEGQRVRVDDISGNAAKVMIEIFGGKTRVDIRLDRLELLR